MKPSTLLMFAVGALAATTFVVMKETPPEESKPSAPEAVRNEPPARPVRAQPRYAPPPIRAKDPLAAQRSEAIETRLVDAPEALSPRELDAVLSDAEPEVRQRVLSQALLMNAPVRFETLERLALRDADPEVRRAAVAALAFQRDAAPGRLERLAAEAASDTDPAVQSAAVELLEHLEATHSHAAVLEVPASTPPD
jgi:HEAT repeats